MAFGPPIVSARMPGRSGLFILPSAVALIASVLFSPSSAAQSAACRSPDPSQWPPSSKPYFMLAVDTSGSMVSCTNPANNNTEWPSSCPGNATQNSCSLEPTRLNDAKCAMRKTLQAFSGQVNFGLSTYAQRLSGCGTGTVTDSCSGQNCNASANAEYYSGKGCNVSGPTDGDSCGNTPDCSQTNATIYNGAVINSSSTPPIVGSTGTVTLPGDNWRNGGNIVVDMLKDTTWAPASQPATNVPELLQWFDNRSDNNREIFAAGSTPLEGILRTVHQYYAAGWSSSWANTNYCATGGPTIDHPSPIEPSNDRPCRSLNVILVTDGDETCNGTPANAALALYKVGVVIGGTRVPVRTHVIGFAGASAGQLNPIADAGDDGTTNSSKTALFANNEVELAQALSTIISGSVSPETCDNADNNCNGCIDEGSKLYCNRNKTPTALATLQASGTKTMCCQWSDATQRAACVTAHSNSISASKPKGDQWFLPCWDANTDTSNIESKWLCSDPGETCDDKDNNCDVQVDKAQSNFSTNTSDESELKCGSPAHCPVAEACPPNNQDDDCDGVIDNAVGSGVPYSACPGSCQPSPELCNGCDDDCDGVADNGITALACGFSPPANCAGTRACPAVPVASPGACIPGVTPPGVSRYGACSSTPGTTDVTCDNLDDNCNGVIDEGAPPTPCTNGQPGLVYADVNPASQCVKGQQPCRSTACIGWIGPSQEICDGKDNDCDGLVDAADSDLVGVGATCGSAQGVCTRGTTACVGGAIVCTGGTQPQPEVCDGLDNNCNGQTDEAPLNDGPAPGAGGCWRTAGSTCTFQNVSWSAPSGATCNSVGSLTAPCQAGALVCMGSARWACQGGTGPSSEICDGLDNNCNGQVDSSDTGITGTGGACAPPGTVLGSACQGTTQCTAGQLVCNGGASPSAEICDGKDNDCDGLVDGADSDLVGVGTVCGSSLGICKTGITACVNGATVCQGEVKPGTETCNGLDDNCDGAPDNNLTDAPPSLGCWNLPGAACSGGGLTWSPPPGGTCTGVGSLTAPCAAGILSCTGAAGWICQGGTVPSTEVCDGADNDCDGAPDENNPGGGTACGTAPDTLPCKKGTLNCVSGQLVCQGEVSPTPELCDGVDNDCDGTPDDNITSGVGNSCGSSTGICRRGVSACVNGNIQCQGEIAARVEVCNGLDDDCDGAVDNHLTDGPATPGCWQRPGNTCTFRNVSWDPPAGATCDAPGSLRVPCRTGTLVCAGSTGWACAGGVQPSPENCDSIDNDCDGQTDEGNPGGGVACGATTGACEPGTLQCTGGNLTCTGGVPPAPEICDGIDNNCDGNIDEPANIVGVGQICGSNVGVCRAGTTVCVNGAPVCQGEIKASPEVCDGKDNDCNGSIDDQPTDTPANPGCWNNAGSSCTFGRLAWDPPPGATCNGVGSLSAPCSAGALVCRNGGWECAGGRLPANSEVCDGVDNNCNGAADDGDPGGGATCGQSNVGVCKLGVIHCVGGQLICQGEVPPGPELCDGKDNDCDGTPDDNAPGSGVPCTGQCATGTTQCIGGTLICRTTTEPTPEVCDGRDNDCNGLVDDGALGDSPPDPGCWGVPGTTCSYGAAPRPVTTWSAPPGATCTGLGSLTTPCQTGRLRCDGNIGWTCVGGKLPTTEICDGQDQNCNGQVDDGDPGGGAACGINVGTCTFGIQHCVNGQLVCDGQGKKPETCNGKDDDCNGLVDDGLPLGNACFPQYDVAAYPGDRTQGLCERGKLECDPALTGQFVCRGGTGPKPEICNGFDDDCDGKVDEAGVAPDGIDGSVDPQDASRRIGDACGVDVGECEKGRLGCVSGRVICVGEVQAQPELCDCKDNDCNGQIDESSDDDSAPVCGGGSACVKFGDNCQCADPCRSSEFPCPTGYQCKFLPLSSDSSETGNYCVSDACGDCSVKTTAGECGPAGTVDEDGNALPVCSCTSGGCHGPCFTRQCSVGQACVPAGEFAGQCRQNTDCRFFGCPEGRACNAGACVTNPCEPNPCAAGEVCKPSPSFDRARCVKSCAEVKCAGNERCVDGACEPTGCTAACESGEVCLPAGGDGGGACGPSRCAPVNGQPVCNDGSYCDPRVGSCGNDPCSGVLCPGREVCAAGECVRGSTPGSGGSGGSSGSGGAATGSGGQGGASAGGGSAGTPAGGSSGSASSGGGTSSGGKAGDPASKEVIGMATGGGGCRCDLPAKSTTNTRALALGGLALLGLVTRRVRLRPQRPARGEPLRPSGARSRFARLRGTAGERTRRTLFLALFAVLLVLLSGCTTEGFCIRDCEGDRNGSGGSTSGPPDGGGGRIVFPGDDGGCVGLGCQTGGSGGGSPISCVPTNDSREICDGKDNDCDGQIDEAGTPPDGIDFANPVTCGNCATNCTDPSVLRSVVTPLCTPPSSGLGTIAGACDYDRCAPDHYDVDGNRKNGCEYGCPWNPGGANKKDLGGAFGCKRDDDCNGKVDDGIDVCADPENCGECGVRCSLPNTVTADCVTRSTSGTCDTSNTGCVVKVCAAGFVDANGSPDDGCEYPCTVTNGGVEICDGKDNDCDKLFDNADPSLEDPALGVTCYGGDKGVCASADHAGVVKCIDGAATCCDVGSNNLNAENPRYPDRSIRNNRCQATDPPFVVSPGELQETCDSKDNDCDGAVDGVTVDTAAVCGSSVGVCRTSVSACINGLIACPGAILPDPAGERCDGLDNDCDGVIDGTAPAARIPCGNDGDCAGHAPYLACVQLTADTANKGCVALPADIVDQTSGAQLACDVTPPPPSGATSPCKPGKRACFGGVPVCVDSVKKPSDIDRCFEDTNCDGVLSNQSGLANADPKNCGSCGKDCNQGNPNANFQCQAGACVPNGCRPGFIECGGGSPNDCETACVFDQSTELCDGRDNDCDCQVDEGVVPPSPIQACGVSAAATDPGCTGSVSIACTGGVFKCTFTNPAYCTGGSCPTTPDICDGKDNDCDGVADEGFRPPALAIGFLGQACFSDDGKPAPGDGPCRTQGAFVCRPDGTGTLCAAPKDTTKATPETCDGVDNDCNGVVDDANAVRTNDTRVGKQCFGGTNGVCAAPGAAGSTSCVSGAVVCSGPNIVRPGDRFETCNGLDDDCSGVRDDNLTDVGGFCGSGVGQCRTGTQTCVNGALTCTGNTGPVAELCDGLDNDCNGQIDDSPTDVGTACSVPPPPPSGVTQPCRAGTNVCIGGARICQGAVTAASTTDNCNEDTNCDGRLTNQSGLTNGDVLNCGACGNNCNARDPNSNWSCQNGACVKTSCKAGFIDCDGNANNCERACTPTASGETCNGLDDNCDCQVDNALPPVTSVQVCGVSPAATEPGCTTGVTAACVSGAYRCTFPAGYCTGGNCSTTVDTCDGRDNNCNGTADETFKPPLLATGFIGQPCSTPASDGPCRGSGTYQCNGTGTATACNAVKDNSKSTPEVCDGVDNNCNGTADEASAVSANDSRVNKQCFGGTAGECAAPAHAGTTACQSGSIVCTGANVLRPGAVAETCNGKDDDCNGTPDNSPTDVGGTCGSAVGACTPGTYACVSGARVCQGNTSGSAEKCNGIDDDCDNTIDDSPTDVGTDCNVPAALPAPTAQCPTVTSPCQKGTLTCSGGVALCQNSVTATASTPDGCCVDSNCDGVLTNQPNFQTDVANCGGCGNDCNALGAGKHGIWACQAGACVRTGCANGFINCDGVASDCERACPFSGTELCNGVDDNCDCSVDNLDTSVTPLPTPSQVCGVSPSASDPKCLAGNGTTGVRVQCTAGAWQCTFPTGYCGVGTPAACSTTPDVCDGADNNCNGNTDENHKPPIRTTGYVNQPCASDDGQAAPGDGACRTTGTFQCTSPTTTACNAVRNASLAGPELCDGIDNDCDKAVDEPFTAKGTNTTHFVRPAVVQVSAGLWIYQYEASRPLATASTPGSGNGYFTSAPVGSTLDKTVACSVKDKIPWFNVTPVEVEQACIARGGTICSTPNWTTACQAGASCAWGYGTNCSTAAIYPTVAAPNPSPFCNLGGYDFDRVFSAPNTDGLLPTGSSFLSGCFAKYGADATTSILDITGNLREITRRNTNDYPLMGGAFSSQSDDGAACNFNFYSVNTTFKFYDTGFRCCFTSNPTL